MPIETLSLHSPATIIAGLDHLGIPVSHYVGVDLHTVDPASSLGQLATGKLSVTSLISDPTGTTSLLEQVASHVYLGPGTPVSAVLSLMNVPTANPVNVPTDTDGHGKVVLAFGLLDHPARLPVVATGRGRGGFRRWREWLHRATHHSAADDRHLVQAAEQSRRDSDDEAGRSSGSGGSGGPAEAGGDDGSRAQASLDQVLRRAAEARDTVRHDQTG